MKNLSKAKRSASKRALSFLFVAIVFIGLVAWGPTRKTYSNRFITFSYPDTYRITDVVDGGDEYDLCCEIKGDDLATINFSMTDSEDFLYLDQDEKDMALKYGAMSMKEEFTGNDYYSGLKCTEIKKIKKGNYTGFGFTFTATVITLKIQGECFITCHGATLLATVAQAETTNYMSQLNEIISSIKIK